MHNTIYENTSPHGSPVPQYDSRRAVPREYVQPGVPCSPPEAASKSYGLQDLYDQLNFLKRSEEAHAKWRHEVEKKCQEQVRELKREIKLLKKENSQLLSKEYAPLVTNPAPVQNVFLDEGDIMWPSRVRSKYSSTVYMAQTPIETQKLIDDIKSLYLVNQHLNEDKTHLIQELTKADEESNQLRNYGIWQKGKIQELFQRNKEMSIELTQLNCKVLNSENENANLTLIVKENLAGIK